MTAPKRIQMSRQHPWRAQHPSAVICARPTMWGNPYTVAMMKERIAELRANGIDTTGLNPQALAVEAFEADLTLGPDSPWWWPGPHMAIITMKAALQRGALRGLDLACWCGPDDACHVDVLIRVANAAADRKRRADREAKARQRSAMTPAERAEARLEHDRAYREAHREKRREYDRARYARTRGAA